MPKGALCGRPCGDQGKRWPCRAVLRSFRHPLASDTRHSLYRTQAERWLESLVCEDATRIDVALDPRFYLVAPALRFHPATDTLLRYFSPQLEVLRVGLAETWRRGLRVVMRQ